jgi:L-aspartate oxidase
VVADMEFVQFHPTTLYVAGASRHLISETVRGEGGQLVDKAGHRFMPDYHPMGDLAPRDVVSRAIVEHTRKTGETHVFLDLTHLPDVRKRFPGIAKACSQFSLDIAKDRIPVRPAAHYMIGGAKVDDVGRTTLANLFACGEVSATGLHGANRLGSNSLLEGLVYGRAAGRQIVEELAGEAVPDGKTPERIRSDVSRSTRGELNLGDVQSSLRSLMWRNVGIVRHEEDLSEADALIGFWQSYVLDKVFDQPTGWELQNMLTLGRLIAHAAHVRTETRGVHYRSDFPERDDAHWQRHILMAREQEISIE